MQKNLDTPFVPIHVLRKRARQMRLGIDDDDFRRHEIVWRAQPSIRCEIARGRTARPVKK
jgi:hypothetical protein